MPTSSVIARQQHRATHAVQRRWRGTWLTHWEFWLALAVAAFLRLWHLDTTEYLGDQVGELGIARLSILHRALPLTGIQYSIGTYSPPLDIFFNIPFQLASKDVFPAIVALALWNVVAVGICYIFAVRYFGRTVAAIASLLYATSNAAIHHSFFQWEPNYIAPFAGLLVLALFAGCVAESRRWFVPAGIVFAAMLVLHQITVLLAPAFVLAYLLARYKPTGRHYLIVACTCVVMLLPTVLFELLSNFIDGHLIAQYLRQPSHLDHQWLDTFAQVLGVSTFSGLSSGFGMAAPNASTPFSQLLWTHRIFEPAAVLLFLTGYPMLTWRIISPLVALWRQKPEERGWRRWPHLAASYLAYLRTNPLQRAYLLLWVWVTFPPLAVIRHSSPVQVHYFLDLYPALFVISGLAMVWSLDWLLQRIASVSTGRQALARTLYPAARVVLFGALGILIGLQGLSWALYSSALEQGQFRVDHGYGYPLGELHAADRALASLQQRLGSPSVLISNSWDYQAASIENVLVSEEASRASYTGDCLLLPPPSSPASLVVTTQSTSDAAQFLTSSLQATQVESIRMPGGDPFEVYTVRQPPGPLPGEHLLAQPVFADAAGASLRLDSWARDATGKLRLRWTVLSTTPVGASPAWYRVVLHAYDDAITHVPLTTSSSCQPTRWQAGEVLYTWTPIVPPPQQDPGAPAPARTPAPMPTVQVQPYVVSWWEPTVGSLRTESTRVIEQSFPPLVTRAGNSTASSDTYPLPASAVTP